LTVTLLFLVVNEVYYCCDNRLNK